MWDNGKKKTTQGPTLTTTSYNDRLVTGHMTGRILVTWLVSFLLHDDVMTNL